jgi:hypothetical protein
MNDFVVSSLTGGGEKSIMARKYPIAHTVRPAPLICHDLGEDSLDISMSSFTARFCDAWRMASQKVETSLLSIFAGPLPPARCALASNL